MCRVLLQGDDESSGLDEMFCAEGWLELWNLLYALKIRKCSIEESEHAYMD